MVRGLYCQLTKRHAFSTHGLPEVLVSDNGSAFTSAQFLFQYRLTPHLTTGQPPAELLMGRRPRSHLNFLFPSVAQRVQQSQERQKTNHDQHVQSRTFQVGDEVYVVNHRGPLSGFLGWLSSC